jgi:hypothetical protein
MSTTCSANSVALQQTMHGAEVDHERDSRHFDELTAEEIGALLVERNGPTAQEVAALFADFNATAGATAAVATATDAAAAASDAAATDAAAGAAAAGAGATHGPELLECFELLQPEVRVEILSEVFFKMYKYPFTAHVCEVMYEDMKTRTAYPDHFFSTLEHFMLIAEKKNSDDVKENVIGALNNIQYTTAAAEEDMTKLLDEGKDIDTVLKIISESFASSHKSIAEIFKAARSKKKSAVTRAKPKRGGFRLTTRRKKKDGVRPRRSVDEMCR